MIRKSKCLCSKSPSEHSLGGFEVRRMEDASDASRFCKGLPASASSGRSFNPVRKSKRVLLKAATLSLSLRSPYTHLPAASSLRSADQFSHRDSLQRLTKAHKRLTKGHKGWREKWPLFLLSSGNQGVLTLIGTAFMKMRFTQNKTQRTFLITFINRRNTYALGVPLCRRFGEYTVLHSSFLYKTLNSAYGNNMRVIKKV